MEIKIKETNYVFKKVHCEKDLEKLGGSAPGYNLNVNEYHTSPRYPGTITGWVDHLKKENVKHNENNEKRE